MKMLSVDPGLTGMGWAVWNDSWLLEAGTFVPKPNGRTDVERIHRAAAEVTAIGISRQCEKVVVEEPQFFGGVGGQMVAARGDLVKMALLVGAIIGMARDAGMEPQLVKVNTWKGQLPKKVVESRITRILGAQEVTSFGLKDHAWDAVGIGLYIQGRF